MQRRHGSQDWTKVNLQLFVTLAVTLVLTGSAPIFAQTSDESRAWQRVASEVTGSPWRDANVQYASHSEPIASRPSKPEAQEAERSIVKVYEVRELLEKLREEEAFPEGDANGPVKQALVGHLRYFAAELPDPSRALVRNQQPKKKIARAQFAWHGDQLVVSAPESQHQRLAREIELRRKHGFQQVSVEVRLMTGDPQLYAQPKLGAAPEEDVEVVPLRDRWVLFRQEFANAETMHSTLELGVAPRDENAPRRPSIKVTSGRSDPVLYQFVDDAQMRSFMELFRFEDDKNAIIMAPKVTLFNGQVAEISDTSQRPFVTDVQKVVEDDVTTYQPVINVFWEGVKIQLEPTITDGGHSMRCRFIFASIDGCQTFRPPQCPDAADTRVQHPVVSTSEFQCDVDIPGGQTLLIGGLFPSKVKRKLEQGVVSRMLGQQPATVEREQVTYIAITPRTLEQQGKR